MESDREISRLVREARSDTVTKDRLTQRDTTGIISRGIKLSEQPLIEYIDENENPQFILFTNGSINTLQAPDVGKKLEKSEGWPCVTICITDKNIKLIQSKNKDRFITISLDSITDHYLGTDQREIVLEFDDTSIVRNVFNKFNKNNSDIETTTLAIKINNLFDEKEIEDVINFLRANENSSLSRSDHGEADQSDSTDIPRTDKSISNKEDSYSSEDESKRRTKFECNITVHPEPSKGTKLHKIMQGEQKIIGDSEITEKYKILGKSYSEHLREYTPNQNVIVTGEGLEIETRREKILLGFDEILDSEFVSDAEISMGYKQTLREVDYIRLIVGESENVNGEPDGAFYVYLVGPSGRDKWQYYSDPFDGNNKFPIQNKPSVNPSQLKKTSNEISDKIGYSWENLYILQDYIQRPATLKVEGWQNSGDTRVQADVSGGVESSGRSRGVQVGPFSASKTKSQGKIMAEVNGSISDNSFTSKINFIQVSEEGIFIDSDPVLNFTYQEVDQILPRDNGFTIEAGGTSYSILGPKNPHIGIISIQSDKTDTAVGFMDKMISKSNQHEDDSDRDSVSDKLRELKELHEDGVLTDEEFESKKEELLDDF